MSQWNRPDDFFALLRCTSVKHARSFIDKGQIKFSTPRSWVEYAKLHGRGRGDLCEGSYAGCHIFDAEYFANYYNLYRDVECLYNNNRIYFKRKSVMELPCFCIYLLKYKQFDCPSNPGRQKIQGAVPPEYFRGFAENKSPEEIEQLPLDDRPAIIIIEDSEEFFKRLKANLISTGFVENELILQQVYYDDLCSKLKYYQCSKKSPYELFLKDNYFEMQNEARMVVNSHNGDLIKKLLDKPLELGDLSDIAQMANGYLYDGMGIQFTGNIVAEEI